MSIEAQRRSLSLDRGELVYLAAGSGPLVVLTHALGPLAWRETARLAATCTVAIPDWEASTLDRKAQVTLEWFEPLARELGHERGTLGAWSMSGPGAIFFASEGPAALERLILVDVAGLGDGFPSLSWRDLPHFLAMRLLGRPTRGFVRMLWRNWVWRDDLDTSELEEATLRFFLANRDAYGMPGSDDDDEDEDETLIEELDSITVPTLVLAGRHSEVLGPKQGRTAVEHLPHGELVVFEESGHSLQLEEPEKFQDVVARFVTGADPA